MSICLLCHLLISAVCLFCDGCHCCPTPDGVSMCFLSAACVCMFPQHALRYRVPQCPENTLIFRPRREISVRDGRVRVTDCQQSGDVCAGGLCGRRRGLFGLRVDFQCDSWSLSPAGYSRLTPRPLLVHQ